MLNIDTFIEVIDSTKEDINLKLITNEKISNLFYDSENDDKIVNISK